MKREFYLNLAAQNLRMPVGTDLVLREQADSEAILFDGARLGKIVVDSARRYRTPLAIPLMDLTVEKSAMLAPLNVPAADVDSYHFGATPTPAQLRAIESMDLANHPRMAANLEAIRTVAREKDLVAIGMAIGPFSLMTKLVADPIGPVYMAGTGITGAEDPEVQCVETLLELATKIIEKSIKLQVAAGAKAVFLCEPAANKVYFSPKQLEEGSDIFERYVMHFNQRICRALAAADADLIFHCCGELTDEMVGRFASLRPALLSLGSSRVLWNDARLVQKDTVLYGNLPSKKFYSDDLVSVAQVTELANQLVQKMKDANHPFILGSECDVLSVPGSQDKIRSKVKAMLGSCGCECGCSGKKKSLETTQA